MAKRKPRQVNVDKNSINKSLTLFDHINNLTFNKKKYDKNQSKTFEPYMINRFLSMNKDFVEIVNIFQKYTIGQLNKKEVYNFYLGILPKKKYYLKYIKGKNKIKYKKELINYISKYYEISNEEAIDYLEIYYQSQEGIDKVKEIIRKYGIDDKKIENFIRLEKN